ncbi:hypothetical protein GGX14DRAFT_403581 [Mycena pura]|uniref:Uncharacterized protein n=1 Tax=Mycena pura TaxID=153505 RepID=A0AAD6UXS6_9AGAR|nr:hypothetical protein GGX14DRAFT_403581 [Mycena pura]
MDRARNITISDSAGNRNDGGVSQRPLPISFCTAPPGSRGKGVGSSRILFSFMFTSAEDSEDARGVQAIGSNPNRTEPNAGFKFRFTKIAEPAVSANNVKNQTDVMPKLQRNKADVGIDPNARSAQGRSGRSGPKASGARNWIKHKSLGSPNEKCGTCEESNDQAYKARKSEREDRGCTQTRTKVSGPEPS